MNGAEATKAILLSRIADKLDSIESNGCNYGKIMNEREKTLFCSINEIKDGMKELSVNLTKGIVAVIVLAFIAGANLLESLFKLMIR